MVFIHRSMAPRASAPVVPPHIILVGGTTHPRKPPELKIPAQKGSSQRKARGRGNTAQARPAEVAVLATGAPDDAVVVSTAAFESHEYPVKFTS